MICAGCCLNGRGRTIDKIAKELGVGSSTVERAEKFSKGIDALSAVNKEAADEVLKGKTGVSKKTIMSFPNMEPVRQQEVAESIMRGDIKKEQKKSNNQRGWTKEDRESRALKNIAPCVILRNGKQFSNRKNTYCHEIAKQYNIKRRTYRVDESKLG